MGLQIIHTPLEGLFLIKPDVFFDSRGYFFESYNKMQWDAFGLKLDFVQDNQSLSQKNILRGLHFQAPPYAQGKLVRVIKGAALDVALDIRKYSATYGQYFLQELSEANFLQMYVPEGFAHGFLTLEDDTIFAYKCTGYYNAKAESGIMWNDKDLAIPWNTENPVISGKDAGNMAFKDFISPF